MNKAISLLITASFMGAAAEAQVQPGAVYPEFSATQNFLKLNNTSYRATLSAGLTQHSTLGFFISRTRYNASTVIGFDSYSTQSGAGVTYNYYRYFNSRSKWGWYVNAGAGLYTIKVYDKTSGTYQENNRYGQNELFVSPGIFFTPAKNVMVFAGTGGLSLANNKYETFYLRSSLLGQFTLGVRITIGGGDKAK